MPERRLPRGLQLHAGLAREHGGLSHAHPLAARRPQRRLLRRLRRPRRLQNRRVLRQAPAQVHHQAGAVPGGERRGGDATGIPRDRQRHAGGGVAETRGVGHHGRRGSREGGQSVLCQRGGFPGGRLRRREGGAAVEGPQALESDGVPAYHRGGGMGGLQQGERESGSVEGAGGFHF